MKEIKKRNKVWSVKYRPDDPKANSAVKEISDRLKLSEICSRLIYNRGFHTAAEAERFLKNEDIILHDPFLLRDLDLAIDRISRAIEANEQIVIYGDYDVDGVTSVSMMYLYLTEQGAKVDYYIPSRDGDGYGLSVSAIDKLVADRRVDLIITVDTGITANDETEYARSRGVDMVITDHHECRPELPDACAVVNPHRPDCEYPFVELAGVGVVFKLICGYEMMLCRKRGIPDIDGVRKICRKYADLTSIGTIADVMPIIDENRLIVKLGLEMIAKTERKGLAALIEASSAPGNGGAQRARKITSGFIGYGIAPRINAAGRISSATKAVTLLLADNDDDAKRCAAELCEINKQRQTEENRIAERAMAKIEETFDPENDRIIVIDDDNWQQGIIGIVASRITEKYGLPSILISFDGSTRGYPGPDDLGKGSGRSIKGMNLVGAMTACADLLYKYGGHELAAGLTIERGKIPEFKRRINEYAKSILTDEQLAVSLEADTEIDLREINMSLASEIAMLEPFGVANAVPQFIVRNVRVEKIIQLSMGKHTKLIVSSGGVSLTAIYFGMDTMTLNVFEGESVDILAGIDINVYQNIKSVQLIVQDCRISTEYREELAEMKKRYCEIKGGAEFLAQENVIPTRDDFARVYKLLQRESRNGGSNMSVRLLLCLLNLDRCEPIGYIKLKFIIRILHELKICGIEKDANAEDRYIFDMYFNNSKTSIDKSNILKKLKSQCKNR